VPTIHDCEIWPHEAKDIDLWYGAKHILISYQIWYLERFRHLGKEWVRCWTLVQ